MITRVDGIRPRVDGDLPALVEGLAEVARADGYPSIWPRDPAAWLRADDLIGGWVALQAGSVVGQVLLRRPADDVPADLWSAATGRDRTECAVIKRLFVVPAARGTGLGRALMTVAGDTASGLGRHSVLDVTDRNQAAVRLYERLGWTRLGSFEVAFGGAAAPELLHAFAAP